MPLSRNFSVLPERVGGESLEGERRQSNTSLYGLE